MKELGFESRFSDSKLRPSFLCSIYPQQAVDREGHLGYSCDQGVGWG